MAKMDFRKLRNEYIRRSMRYADGVRLLYDQALSDIAREFATVDYNPDTTFSFSKYGMFGRVDDIMSRLEQQIQSVVNVGIENEFGAAYKAHNDLMKQVLGDNITTEMERAFAPRMTSGNAAKLFISENAANNITRSMRVWNGATLGQMETAVQEALMEGMPAKQMAGLMEEYLIDPGSCFKRFRIKTGVDDDGKSMYGRKWKKRVRNEDGTTSWFDADPRDYPTGQGVYHSSYQNALRYTRTTTNIAYRTADYERYQTEDFVIGIEIHITGNPEHKEDICDMLQGAYPKDFKWVGWHVSCRCFQVPILATPDEVNAMADAIMNDQDPSTVPVAGRVTDVPDNFKEWVANNQDRIQETIDNGKQLPYFLRDNIMYVNDTFVDANIHISAPEYYIVKDSDKLSYVERLENLRDRLKWRFGENSQQYRWEASYIEEGINGDAEKWFNRLMSQDTIKRVVNPSTIEEKYLYEVYGHLDELRNIDASVIAKQWSKTFHDVVGKINAYDIAGNGVMGIHNEIEHAYNIYKLSTTDACIKYGLGRLSDKTPYNIFTVVSKHVDGMEGFIPKKEFWDSLDRYIPLLTNSRKRYSYHNSEYRIVSINSWRRMNASDWKKSGLFHHEYGHAMDYTSPVEEWQKRQDVIDVWHAVKEHIKNNKTHYEELYNSLVSSDPTWKTDWNKVEQVGSFSDIFQAATGKRLNALGHDEDYYKYESAQIVEFLAHASENYWGGNALFKTISPTVYEATIELMKILLGL